jgi:hypothetical protein
MKTLFRILALTFITSFSYGQTTTKEIIDNFFVKYTTDPIKAFDYAFSTNQFFDQKSDAIINLKNQFRNTVELCGKYNGHELITRKPTGQSIEMVTYFLKYDRQPLRLTFFLYKPSDKWQVQNLSFETDFDKELEEAVKLNNLQEGK